MPLISCSSGQSMCLHAARASRELLRHLPMTRSGARRLNCESRSGSAIGPGQLGDAYFERMKLLLLVRRRCNCYPIRATQAADDGVVRPWSRDRLPIG